MHKTFYKDHFGNPLIYLISPSKIDIKTFPGILLQVLETQAVNVFQLRLKNYKDSDLISITSLLYKICLGIYFIYDNMFWLSTLIPGLLGGIITQYKEKELSIVLHS